MCRPEVFRGLAFRALSSIEKRGNWVTALRPLNGTSGHFEVSLDREKNALEVHLHLGDPRSLFFIIERIRIMFDLNADWAVIAKTLRSDALLARLAEGEEGLRIPGCWNAFELTTWAILGRQVSLARGSALVGRIVKTFGQRCSTTDNPTHLFPVPEALVVAKLASIGLPAAKADTIRAFARAVCEGQIRFQGIMDCESFQDAAVRNSRD